MNTLWAPWRLEYIRHISPHGCFLCDLFKSSRDRENLVLKRGVTCAVVMNRYPYNNGHLMICPYRHIAAIAPMTRDERLETMDLIAEAMEALKAALHPDGFNVGLNVGRVAGAGLESHVHTHLVPRWSGDTNFMPVIGETKVIPQLLHALWDELHAALDR